MNTIQNTFWTIIQDNYYRLKDNKLYTAPAINNEVDTDKFSKVLSIESDVLKLVNLEFGSFFEF